MSLPHATRAIKVWIDADEGIADFVLLLNEIPGIRTLASCQGTIGEGGANPYEAQVMVQWEDEAALARLSAWRMTRLGETFGYVHPAPGEVAGSRHGESRGRSSAEAGRHAGGMRAPADPATNA